MNRQILFHGVMGDKVNVDKRCHSERSMGIYGRSAPKGRIDCHALLAMTLYRISLLNHLIFT